MTPKSSKLPCIDIDPYDEDIMDLQEQLNRAASMNIPDYGVFDKRSVLNNSDSSVGTLQKIDIKSMRVISDKLQEAIDNADNTVLCKSMIWSARGWLDEFIRRFE
mgnify:FL=1